ncbi:P-loop containing nucleoside triphosphate hydrolases superfamily protein [Wolffia australiana]
MGSVRGNELDEEYSVLGEEDEVGFLDFEDASLHHFDPLFDDGPVIISMPFPFIRGKPQSALVGETAADRLTIKNTTDDAVELWSVRIYSCNPQNSYLLSLMRPPGKNSEEHEVDSFLGLTELEDRVLQPHETLEIWLTCSPQEVGLHTVVIHIVVGDEKLERVAFVLADDSISQALAASKPFYRARKAKNFDLNGYVPASNPSKPFRTEIRRTLPRFLIPPDLRALIKSNQIPDVVKEGLSRKNYAAFFSTLLIMEEIHLEGQMRGFDMECVELKRKGKNAISLVIHGLAERRPSLVFGDFLFVKPAYVDTRADSLAIQGIICRVESDEILVEFPQTFHDQHYEGKRYDITFGYNRVSMRKFHLAVQIADETGHEILFPSCRKKPNRPGRPFIPFNKNLNQEQLRSVDKILGCRGAPPYIIYGPPGTGKTMTLVEAILQICQKDTNARILVCTPSNSAADHILDKLIAATEDSSASPVQRSKIFRLNAASRVYEDVNPDHIQFCFLQGITFQCPPFGALLRYSVIISTYMSSYQLYAVGLRRGHFGYMLLDEAGQATEPETMVPLMGLCTTKTVVVLAGDPMQLGPVVCSDEANCRGLGRSYLQRLCDLDPYAGEDPDYMTKLVRNYRSHPAILDLPSNLFYKGELIPCKDKSELDELMLQETTLGLPNKEFPVLFVGIQGCDEREGSSPSWFNRTEISKVVEIIQKLRSNADLARLSDDIGIITPYLQQVLKLKKALLTLDMEEVKVGSVEHFQGQEKEVIILSTVRSTVKHNEFDRVHSLGFLTNPRRFNVAITRAKSLLIIIGNPHVIAKDQHWDKLLRYCAGNGSYLGCPLPDPEIPHHLPIQDSEVKVSEWVACDWDESPLSLRRHDYSSKCDENLPSKSSQKSNASAWDGKLSSQPSEYSNSSEWDEKLLSQSSQDYNSSKRDEKFMSQRSLYSKSSKQDENLPSQSDQFYNSSEWDEKYPSQPSQYYNSSEQDENLPSQPSQRSTLSEWDEKLPSQSFQPIQYSIWDKQTPSQIPKESRKKKLHSQIDHNEQSQYSNQTESREKLPSQTSQFSNQGDWDERLPSWQSQLSKQPNSYSNEVEWDEELPSQDAYALPSHSIPYSTWEEPVQCQGKPTESKFQSQRNYSRRGEEDQDRPSQNWNEIETSEKLPSQRFGEDRGYQKHNRSSGRQKSNTWQQKKVHSSDWQRAKPRQP